MSKFTATFTVWFCFLLSLGKWPILLHLRQFCSYISRVIPSLRLNHLCIKRVLIHSLNCLFAVVAMAQSEKNAVPQTKSNPGLLTRRQAAIWTPIVFFIIAIAAVYALFAIDDIKKRDTILYAKFLANLKDR